jgi:fluoride exporter
MPVSTLSAIALVGTGGALGAIARYLVGRAAFHLGGPDFPWGTLVANIAGGFLMGLLVGFLALREAGQEPLRLFFGVGLLGGFTTFSAFSLEVMLMLERGQTAVALGYVTASVVGSVLALMAGLMLARSAVA